MVRPGPEGEDRTVTKVAITRALISVYDKTGLEDLARGAAPGRRRDRLHRQHGGGDRGRGRAGDQGRGRSPASPSAWTAGSRRCTRRVHAGLLADPRAARARGPARRAGYRARSSCWCRNLYPFEQTVASGAAPADCVEQIDIGGPGDGPRGGEEPRRGRRRHRPVAVPGRAGRRPRRAAASRWSSAAAWRRGPTRTRPPTTPRSPPGSPRPTRRTRPRGTPACRT